MILNDAEPVALKVSEKDGVRPQQRSMKDCCWDHKTMEAKNQVQLSSIIADPPGMTNAESCEFVKKGNESVGVSRQNCGSIGKVENCQSDVFIG